MYKKAKCKYLHILGRISFFVDLVFFWPVVETNESYKLNFLNLRPQTTLVHVLVTYIISTHGPITILCRKVAGQ